MRDCRCNDRSFGHHAYIRIYTSVSRKIENKTYYTAGEAAEKAGVHRLTLLRWIREGKISDVSRDRNNWRLFSEDLVRDLIEFSAGLNGRTSPQQRVLFGREKTTKSS